jgi:tRNA threonylcarbamoyladenosine biosynthesis protein TsaB
MSLLAIDTSTDLASVALLCDGKFFYKEQSCQRTHAQRLLPMVDEVMSKARMQMKNLDAIIFGCGPGSFTGLRISCSLAKGLAYAYDLNLIPVSSLASIAWVARKQMTHSDLPILTILDARMQEVYWAYYLPGQFSAEEHVNRISDIVLPDTQSIALAGIGIDEYGSEISKKIKARIDAQVVVYPSAIAMIELVRATSIPPVSVAEAKPVYVRNQVTWDKNKI